MWDCVRKAFHILIHDSFPINCVLTSGPASRKERSGSCFSFTFCLCRLGLHTCHSVGPLLSVALVSTLATMSVHFSVTLVSTLATVSVHFRLCRVGLHTCHSVSPLLSLSPWSPHLPQCQSISVSVALVSTLATVSVHSVLKRLSHCPCGYTEGTTE